MTTTVPPVVEGLGSTVVFYDSARQSWGAEQSLFTLAEHLQRQGHRTALVCWSPALADDWRERGLGPSHLLPATAGADRWRDLAVLARGARRLPPGDVAVVFSFALLPAVPLLRAVARPTTGRFVLDLHDNLPGRRGRLLLQLTVRAVDAVVAVSRFTAAQVRHGSTTVLYRPLPAGAEPVPRLRRSGDPLVVGIVGRLDAAKQHLVAIRALTSVEQDVRLVLRGEPGYGEPSYLDELRAAVHGAGGRVTVEGRRPQAEALDDLDVLLVTNDCEPMGRTVVEAQLAGLPVVVPDRGGACELVEPGRTGLHFRAGDSADLATVLDRLAADPELASELAAAARVAAVLRHDPEDYARSYAAALLGAGSSAHGTPAPSGRR